MIVDKTLVQWLAEYPIIGRLQGLEELLWINPGKLDSQTALDLAPLGMAEVLDASARLERFGAYLATAFPETKTSGGILESPLVEIPKMQQLLSTELLLPLCGSWRLKCDSHLPISGSIKARGGIYEVLKLAEEIAMREGGLTTEDDYSILAEERFTGLFSNYSIAVGSTGNLGLSIGIMSARLGFRVTVHMSADAREWKKAMLRSKGVVVVEYKQDYSKAVEQGRAQAQNDPHCHFVDDENSHTLFLGYAVAALRLQRQLEEQKVKVDCCHPLFVYLPCGVGGGPGGVAFGLKLVFGDAVHCFFAEPTHSPCMLLGMSTGYHNRLSVQDFGIDNRTVADGLAVGRASGFVGKVLAPLLSGCYTVTDERMYRLLAQLADSENIRLEPSALAGMIGPAYLSSPEGKRYLATEGLEEQMPNATHIVWATGGNMVPPDDMQVYYNTGKEQLTLPCPLPTLQ